ncbi:uncharacterized protein LOC121718238 [Alosa sapidissima]|uniref:uncharacterized protein LOC121718238 n=1 Tax=Alosa sapidissima TaxID=34773 RepID=UPI001C092A74|nr:uncharacterized protein LOC121718238 [Alosa sapidissima]
MVLFVCKYEVEESVIGRHVKATQKLLEKCDHRHFILRNDSRVADLQQVIEDLVRKTCGECLSYSRDILPSYSQAKSDGTAELHKQSEQTVKHSDEMKRRDSSETIRPTMQETGKSEVAVQDQGDILALLGRYAPPSGIIMTAYIGALLGAVAGATDGVAGSARGLVLGVTGGILVAMMVIGAARFSRGNGIQSGAHQSTNIRDVGSTEKAKEQ